MKKKLVVLSCQLCQQTKQLKEKKFMARTLREKQEKLEHTHSKLGIFIEQALTNDLKQDWRNSTGKMEGAKKKYRQLYDEIWDPVDKTHITLTDEAMNLIEKFGSMPAETKQIDSRVWDHLFVYVPRKVLLKKFFRRLFCLSA